MKTVSLIIILILTISHIKGQEIKSYDFDINIDVKSKNLKVRCSICIDFMDKDSISFILWKNSNIHSISSNKKSINYNFDTLSPSHVMFIPNGKYLTVFNPKRNSKGQNIEFDYECNMQGLEGWAKSFSEEWIELNLYSGWYPIYWNSRNFKSKIKLTIDNNYLVTGSGLVNRKNGCWEIEQPWLSSDNVIIASKNLKSKRYKEKNIHIEIIYSKLSEADADSILWECNYVSNLYQEFYGENDSTYLKFVIIPYMRGGYGRKNFSTLRTTEFNDYTRGGIAHEMAHFWWSNANSTTWEDWLNEAFAEYSMLMYFRERFGLGKFNSRIEKYKNNAQNTPPIWGIDRNIPEAYTVLYEKGSLILYELEIKTGYEQFIEFLRLVIENKIETTDKLLKLVEKEISTEIREWLEKQLKS